MSVLKPATTIVLWILLSNIYRITVRADNFDSVANQHGVSSAIHQQQSQPSQLENPLSMQQLQPLETIVKQLQAKRSWQNLQSSWGKRGLHNTDEYDDLSHLYDPIDDANSNFAPIYMDDVDEQQLQQQQQRLLNTKRAWKSMNSSWGKRIGSVWGNKREPGWNNLKGLWGKRANNWNRLSSAWGKRTIPSEDIY